MKLRVVGAACLSVLAITWITGCSSVGDQITDKAAEKAAESLVKNATGADVDLNKDGGSVKIKTDKGEMEIGATEGKLPDGFPSQFPIYSGAQIKSSMKTSNSEVKGKTGFMVAMQTSDDITKVADYYKSKLKSSGYEISSTTEIGNGPVSLGVKKGAENIGNVLIMAEGGKTNITISISN
jgi:hypothetical protein